MRRFCTRSQLCPLVVLLVILGCHRSTYIVPEQPMPQNTVLLSQTLRDLSAKPGFTEALLTQIGDGKGKKGAAFLTPTLVDELRKRILGKDWQGLDRFPGWTMRTINPTVRVVGHEVGKSSEAESLAAVHPGTSPSDGQARKFLDLGPYVLDQPQKITLDQPSTLPGFSSIGLVSELGDGITRGDGPNDLAPEHAESQRLADALNRLAANALDGAHTFTVSFHGYEATTPQALIQTLGTTGEDIAVDDARYFANFGHLHDQGKDVMMPFWVDSQIIIPHSDGRHLLVPVSHAEYEWHLRGPINADISYYFGIDGKSEWRTMDTLDQAWVLKRNAHEYRGRQAVEVTRLAGLLTVAYMHQHAERPNLPFGGYYALGVCQDGVSAIEQKLTGHVTLFPNTVDSRLFDDPRDAEASAMLDAIPKDRDGESPGPERVFGSLPTTDWNAITIPGLADDLNTTYTAWQSGGLNRVRNDSIYLLSGLSVFAFLTAVYLYRRRKARATRRSPMSSNLVEERHHGN